MFYEKIHRNRAILWDKVSAKLLGRALVFRHRYWNSWTVGGRPETVRAFWWTGECNFGDLITPLLLRHFGYIPVLSEAHDARVAATGSILGMLDPAYDGVILGSGLLSDTRKLCFPNATILAVRGALTRDRIGAPTSTPLGDPGLLVADAFPVRRSKRYVLGIVPHYEDLIDKRLRSFVRNHAGQVRCVNVMRSPPAVIRDLDECSYVASSSLHGCVGADALGIPNAWIRISDRVIGKGFKFHDYYSAFGEDRVAIEPSGDLNLDDIVDHTSTVKGDKIEDVKEGLRGAFRSLGMMLRAVR